MNLVFRVARNVSIHSLIGALLTAVVPFASPGCIKILDDAAAKQWESDRGGTSLTVYPVCVRAGKAMTHDLTVAGALAEELRQLHLGTTELATTEIPAPSAWSHNQLKMAKATADAFAEFLRRHPPETEYAVFMEVLMGMPEAQGGRVGGIELYILHRDGAVADITILNDHDATFAKQRPTNAAAALEVLKVHLRRFWGAPASS